MGKIIIIIFLLCVWIVFSGGVPWGTYGGNQRQTFSSPNTGPSSTFQISWFSNQAIEPDGILHVVIGFQGHVYWSAGHMLTAFDGSGSIRWQVGSSIFSWKALALSDKEDQVFVQTTVETPFTYDVNSYNTQNGNLIWSSYPCDYWGLTCSNLGLVMGANQTLYSSGVILDVESYDMYYAAMDITNQGKVYMSFDANSPVSDVVPLIYDDIGYVYTVAYFQDSYWLAAYNWPNGDTKFLVPYGDFNFRYVIGSSGILFAFPVADALPMTSSYVQGVDPASGQVKWSTPIVGGLLGSYCLDRQNNLVAVFQDSVSKATGLIGVNATGKMLFHQSISNIVSNLVVDASGSVYMVLNGGSYYELVAFSSTSGASLFSKPIQFTQTLSTSCFFSLYLGDSNSLYLTTYNSNDKKAYLWALTSK